MNPSGDLASAAWNIWVITLALCVQVRRLCATGDSGVGRINNGLAGHHRFGKYHAIGLVNSDVGDYVAPRHVLQHVGMLHCSEQPYLGAVHRGADDEQQCFGVTPGDVRISSGIASAPLGTVAVGTSGKRLRILARKRSAMAIQVLMPSTAFT